MAGAVILVIVGIITTAVMVNHQRVLVTASASAAAQPSYSNPASVLVSASPGSRVRTRSSVEPLTPADTGVGTGSVPNAAPSGKATTPPPSSSAIPAPAREAGYTQLALGEEFTTSAGIDLSGTGSGAYNWYTDLPFGNSPTPRSALSISNSVLTINPTTETRNFSLLSTSAHTNRGKAFRHGYFEARIAFDASRGAGSTGWPSISLISRDYVRSGATSQMGEIAIFEACHQDGQAFANTFHGTLNQGDWRGGTPAHLANYGANFKAMPGVDFTQFHTYGALWQPGSVTWYFDHQPVFTQRYSAAGVPIPNPRGLPVGTFNVLDTNPNGQTLVLGTGVGQPMEVDWVRVWQ